MKNIPIILFILFVFGCSSKTEKNIESPIADQTLETKVIEKTIEDINGAWINKKYVDELLETKSPRISQEVVDLTMLLIRDGSNKEISFIWGFHEGSGALLLKDDSSYYIKQENFIDEEHTRVFLNGAYLKLGPDEFVKLNINDNEKVVEELLFSGLYEFNGKEVEFKSDGQIIGMDTISYYSVLEDYNDAGMNVDQLVLGRSPQDTKRYGFAFEGSKLTIYEINCVVEEDDYCIEVEFGQELLILRRKL